MNNKKYIYEIREIDAWADPDAGWTWNTSYLVGEMTTNAENVKRAFVRFLNKRGICFKLNRTIIEDCWDIIEIQDRKTREPLYAAIFKERIESKQ